MIVRRSAPEPHYFPFLKAEEFRLYQRRVALAAWALATEKQQAASYQRCLALVCPKALQAQVQC